MEVDGIVNQQTFSNFSIDLLNISIIWLSSQLEYMKKIIRQGYQKDRGFSNLFAYSNLF